MAGHSKWKNIQHRKGAQDKKRGKVFTKVAKEITVAVKLSGDDPSSNPRLRLALNKARAANMPRDNIERAVKKGSGDGLDENYNEKTYEGYGPGGIAVLVECLTDNINRTVSEVRYGFNKFGGNLGTDGSVGWMFSQKGLIVYDRSKIDDFDKLFEVALEAGAEDVVDQDGGVEITCEPATLSDLKDQLDTLGIDAEVAEISYIPENYQPVEESQKESFTKLLDYMDDLDDVQNVYHNAELTDAEEQPKANTQ